MKKKEALQIKAKETGKTISACKKEVSLLMYEKAHRQNMRRFMQAQTIDKIKLDVFCKYCGVDANFIFS